MHFSGIVGHTGSTSPYRLFRETNATSGHKRGGNGDCYCWVA
jgi:hypothetical protein